MSEAAFFLPPEQPSPPAATWERDAFDKAIARLPDQAQAGRQLWRSPDGAVHGQFFDTPVGSRFRAIRRLVDEPPIGHEASVDVPALADWAQRVDTLQDEQLTVLDRLLRVLHTMNFFRLSPPPSSLLFLKVHNRFLSAVTENHGQAFRRVIESFGLHPQQFVIQVQGRAATDLHALGFVMDNYRRNGFLTGLHANDFVEAGSLLGQLRPDYLSLAANENWFAGSVDGLVEAARRFHVRLIGRCPPDSAQPPYFADYGILYDAEYS
ncbi:MAG: EAL domain-containing protein [Burkholderiaceae bacterium]